MPSNRRLKTFGILTLVVIVTLLFYTRSSSSDTSNSPHSVHDLYARTKSALDNGAAAGNAAGVAAVDGMADRLKEAAQVAKSKANAKAPQPDPPSRVNGVGSAAEGGTVGRKKGHAVVVGGAGGEAQEVMKGKGHAEAEETQEEHEVEMELNGILKKSPIIIFSKSYCPHSMRAKNIFKQYTIDPAPYVVELDQHPLGALLQNKLQQLTSRRTVPNVLINAISIGGGDDVAGLDAAGTLVDKVKELAGQKIKEVRKLVVEAVAEKHGL